MEVVVLAGGFGTRLKPLVSDVAKPMAPIKGKPFLSYLLDSLVEGGATSLILSVFHLNETIETYFGESFRGVPIRYAKENEPRGTGGALLFAMSEHIVQQNFLAVNGDTFLKVNYKEFFRSHCQKASDVTLALRWVPEYGRYSPVSVDNTRVLTFGEKRSIGRCLINGGVYAINRDVFQLKKWPKKFAFEQDFLKENTQDFNIGYEIVHGYFIDIGLPTDYRRAIKEIPSLFGA